MAKWAAEGKEFDSDDDDDDERYGGRAAFLSSLHCCILEPACLIRNVIWIRKFN